MTAASAYPASRCDRLDPSWARAGPVTHWVHRVRRIEDNGGKYSDVLCSDHTHQTPISAAGSHTRVPARPSQER